MIGDVLDGFSTAQRNLERALDSEDIARIEAACDTFRGAVFAARATGGWPDRPECAADAAQLLGRVEIMHQRVKNLTRETRERLAGIDAVRGRLSHSLYDRTGRDTA